MDSGRRHLGHLRQRGFVPRPPRRPAPYDQGTFAVAAARRAEVPASSLRSLESPFRGVRSHEPLDGMAERLDALGLVRDGTFAASHCTAAALHQLPVPRHCEHSPLHVMTKGSGRVRRPGVVGHRGLDERSTVTVEGVLVTGLADTWLDLAPYLSLDDLVVVGDAVARRLKDVSALHTRAHRSMPGVARAREALEWVRVGSASPMETRSRVLFGRAGLPEPQLNVPVRDVDGGWLAEGDLVWEEARVVGEYQGATHFETYARGDRDISRRRVVEGAGWTYIDFTKDDYWRRARRIALVRRVAEGLGVTLDPARLAEIGERPGLAGPPLRPCRG